jgi:uncharacterized membrane protein YccC
MNVFKRLTAAVAIVGVAALVLSSCSTEARAERKGKKAGDEICKVRNSDNTDEAQRHLRKAQDDLQDLSRFVGRDINQDAADVQRNLQQLANDVSKGKDVRQQDVNAISRNVQQVSSTASGAAKAAYDGIEEGLANCD